MSAAPLTESVRLNTGASMPKIGLGVWQVTPDAVAEAAVRSAIDRGYRKVWSTQVWGTDAPVRLDVYVRRGGTR